MARQTLTPLVILALLVLRWASLAPPGATAQQPPPTERYIVALADPAFPLLPAATRLERVATAQRDALAAITTTIGQSVAPAYTYRHAFNGFALTLTPNQAAQVATLPGVVAVQREWFETLQTDTSPALIGAAQADLRPALFAAQLTGDQLLPPVLTTATGHAVAHYDAATQTLRFQIFYTGLSSPPTAALIRHGTAAETGAVVLDLTATAVSTTTTTGGYIGSVVLPPTTEAELFAALLSITLTTVDAPLGELRGQLRPSRGEGVVIGVLDTGIDPTHPSFQDPGPSDGYVYTNPRGAGNYLGVCNPNAGDGRYDPTFPCNAKLIGAYTFETTSAVPDPQGRPSPRDNHGHGSHVAGTAAGNVVIGATLAEVPLATLAGIAPHANLISYDVCGLPTSSESCPSAAILAALDQALADGVDIINYSLSGLARDPWQNPEAQALLRATAAGHFVAVAAGNNGANGAGTLSAPANAPWVTAVGAVTAGQRPAGTPADQLYEQSARGPDPFVPDLIKPDLVAPGVEIVAAGADVNPDVYDYVLRTGTSMATPHVSGLAALLHQIHPAWSPAALRSAMQLTAAGVYATDSSPAPLFAQGAGRIAAVNAAMAGFVLDENAAAYLAADPAKGGHPAALNLASLTDSRCVGRCTFTRTLRSTFGVTVTWDLSTSGDGFTLTTEPAGELTLLPGATALITVSATVTRVAPGSYGYGSVRFVARDGLAPAAALPVAIPLTSSTLPEAIAIQAAWPTGSTTVPLRAVAITTLVTTSFGLTKLQPEALALAPDPTPADRNDLAAGGIYRQPVILPVGNVRFRVQLAAATARNVKLSLYVDQAGAGFDSFGPEDQLLCEQHWPSEVQGCDLLASDHWRGRTEPLTVTLLVQNVTGSGVSTDSLNLLWGLVNTKPSGGAENLTVSGPMTVAAGQAFALTVAWRLPGVATDAVYIGVLGLGSSPAAPSDLGTTMITLVVKVERCFLPAVGVVRF